MTNNSPIKDLAALVDANGGWDADSDRVTRDWETLTNGELHSETFSGEKAKKNTAAFKATLKNRAKKIEGKTVRIKTLDKDSKSPMVVFQFVAE